VQELKNVDPNQILTVTEPPRLTPQSAGTFQIQCWINQAFDVEASTDLADWTTVATVTNLPGTLDFEDAEADDYISYLANAEISKRLERNFWRATLLACGRLPPYPPSS